MAGYWQTAFKDNENLLEIVEAIALKKGLIHSNLNAMERFSEDFVLPMRKENINCNMQFEQHFKDWLHTLVDDGELHPIQYTSYKYGRLKW